MIDYQILALDLDGTLTNSQKQITPPTREALIRIQEAGIKVVLASGRPTTGVLPLARELQLQRFGSYILSFNGGRITVEAVRLFTIVFCQKMWQSPSSNLSKTLRSTLSVTPVVVSSPDFRQMSTPNWSPQSTGSLLSM